MLEADADDGSDFGPCLSRQSTARADECEAGHASVMPLSCCGYRRRKDAYGEPAEELACLGPQGATQRWTEAQRRWRQLILSCRRVRQWQRKWGVLGLRLQDVEGQLRDRLRMLWPAPSASGR